MAVTRAKLILGGNALSVNNERPNYFVDPPSREEIVRRRIKGHFRLHMVTQGIMNEGLASVPDYWQAHNLSEQLKESLTSLAGPQARGGEDLPDLAHREVEMHDHKSEKFY